MLNDKDVVGLIAGMLVAARFPTGDVSGVDIKLAVDDAYAIHTKAAERVVQGARPLDDVTSTR